MIRVLQCIDDLGFGGAQTFLMEVYRKLDHTKIQFDFVVFTDCRKGFYQEAEQLGAKIYICPRYNGRNHFKFCNWWNDFFKQHKEYKIIHGHVRSVALLYLSIAKKYGLTTIVHSHSTSNKSGFSALVKAIYQYPLRYCIDWLFACSDESGLWLYGKRAIKKQNYRVIPNCIDTERFSFSQLKREQIRKQLNVDENDILLGHIGSFITVKNHGFLLEIFRDLMVKYPNAKMILVGHGSLLEKTKAKCTALGLDDKVQFLGVKTNTEDYYCAMDGFLMPSLWEGLPLVLVEAQSTGLPCYISNKISPNAILTPLVKCLPIDQGTRPWVESIDLLKKRESFVEEIIKSGFDSKTTASKLSRLYMEMVE